MPTDIPSKHIRRRGVMLVLSSPSGAGKSTIARILLDQHEFQLSVSVTTRERRASEVDKVHYRFISRREFESLRDDDQLLEWAEVHGNYYGTPRDAVEKAMSEGRDMLFDIDWQGAQQMRQKMEAGLVSIFILPPSMAELRTRLKRRAEDSDDIIETRLTNAKVEIERWRDYDYQVVNEDLNDAFDEVKAIVTAERLRRDRRSAGMHDFVSDLLAEKTDRR